MYFFQQATQKKSEQKKLDLSKSDLRQFPDESLFHNELEEVIAGHNSLRSANLGSLIRLKNLKILHLDFNRLKTFPEELLQLNNLKTLNINDNELETLPEDISRLKR